MASDNEKANARMRIFLSYSRRDAAFLKHLAEALIACGYLVDFDQSPYDPDNIETGIAAEDEWWKRLQDMIAAADVMVFVASPASAASKMCDEEITYARSLGKRVTAILAQPIDFGKAQPRLAALNVKVNFTATGPGFEAAIEELCRALNHDVAWLRRAVEITTAAKKWDDAGRKDHHLLRGAAVADAEGWSARRPATAPPVSELALTYISASREAEALQIEQDRRQVQRQGKLQKRIAAAIATALFITVVGAWLVLKEQRDFGRAQSLMIARAAEGLFNDDDYLRGLRLSALAARDTFLSPSTAEARVALARNAQALRLQAMFRHSNWVLGGAISRDGRRVLTWSTDHTAQVWDARTGAPIGQPLRHDGDVLGARFLRKESRVLTWSQANTAVWDLSTGAAIRRFVQPPSVRSVMEVSLSRDETRLLTLDSDETIRVWEIDTGLQIGPVVSLGYRGGGVLSPDGSRVLAWRYYAGRLEIREVGTAQQSPIFLRHDGPVNGAIYSDSGARLLSWSQDGTARLWEAVTGKQIGRPFAHPGGSVIGAILSQDERRVVTWGEDNTARIWDVVTGDQMGSALRHDGTIEGAAFSHDERRVLSWGWDNTARLWNAATGEQSGTSFRHVGVTGASWSSDDGRILTWGEDGTARIWHVDTGSNAESGPVLRHDRTVEGAVFSVDENVVLTWSTDGTARLWDVASSVQVKRPFENGNQYARFSSDHGSYYTRTASTVRSWSTETGAPISPSLEHDGQVSEVVFSPGGGHALTFSVKDSEPPWRTFIRRPDLTTLLWNIVTGERDLLDLQYDDDDDGWVHAGATFSNDGRRLITWSHDNAARIWDLEERPLKELSLEHDAPVLGAVFSPDNRHVVSWSRDRKARVWNFTTSAPKGVTLHNNANVSGALFSDDGSRVLTWSGGGLFDKGEARLWNTVTGSQTGATLHHGRPITGAAFSHDETLMVTWSLDTSARLWETKTGLPTGRTLQQGSYVVGAAFSPDDNRVVTWSSDVALKVWNTESGVQVGPTHRFGNQVSGVKFARDNGVLFSWAYTTGCLIDLATGEQIDRIDIGDRINDAAFSQDGRRILILVSSALQTWNVEWAIDLLRDPRVVGRLCSAKLRGVPSEDGLRRLDQGDLKAAPILRERQGEDVCNWSAPWFDPLLHVGFDWAFP